jgi:formate hydrogenlyase subunit 4
MTDIIIHCAVALLFPPLLLGVIGKTKAAFAGRVGAPYFQPYYDLIKLFRKGSVFSETTTWVFRAGPVVALSATLIAALLIPLGRHAAPLSFSGDLILFAYLFSLARFFTTIAALDTGSSFEGMGAAREVTFSCLAEPTLFFCPDYPGPHEQVTHPVNNPDPSHSCDLACRRDQHAASYRGALHHPVGGKLPHPL